MYYNIIYADQLTAPAMTPENNPSTVAARSHLGFFERFRQVVEELSPGYFRRHNTDTKPDLDLIREKLALLDLTPRQRRVMDHLTSATCKEPTPSTDLVDTLTQGADYVSDGRKILSSKFTDLRRKLNRVGIDVASVPLELSPGDWHKKGKDRVGYYLVYNPELAISPKDGPKKIAFGPPTRTKPSSEMVDTFVTTRGFDPKNEAQELTRQHRAKEIADALNHFSLTLVSHIALDCLKHLSPHVQDVFPNVPGVQLTDDQIISGFREYIERLSQTQQASSAKEKKLIAFLRELQAYSYDCARIMQVTTRYFGLDPQDPPPLQIIPDSGSATSLR